MTTTTARRVLTLLGAIALLLAALPALAVNWTAPGGGNWTTDANWDAAHPNGTGAAADLVGPLAADSTVILDGNITVGSLTLNDGNSNSWSIGPDASPGEVLTFDVPSGNATLTVNQGTANQIAVPVSLTDHIDLTVAAGKALEITGNISGTARDLGKLGAGVLRLSGDNSGLSGRLRINNDIGTIEVTNDNSLGTMDLNPQSYGGGALRINNVSGGPLTFPGGWTPYQGGGHTVSFGGSDMTFSGAWNNRGAGVTVSPDAGITVTLSGDYQGDGGNTLAGNGTVILAGDASSRTGDTSMGNTVHVGIAIDDAFGPAARTIHNYNGGVDFFAIGGARSVAGTLELSAHAYSPNANHHTFSGNNDLTFTGNVTFWQTNGHPILDTTNTGLTTLAGNITQTGSQSIIKQGPSTLVLGGTNTTTWNTRIDAGVVRAQDGTGLSPNSNLVLNGGVLESNGTFSRALGTAGGQVRWTGDGGFSAQGGDLTVDLGAAGPDNLTWGAGGFVTGTLEFGSSRADGKTEMVDNIDLGAGTRAVRVEDNAASAADVAVLSGQLSGAGGIDKVGPGTLFLNGISTNNGLSSVTEGTLGGTGTLGGGLVNASTVAPGTSVGILTVNGDYDQDGMGVLAIEIADYASYDQLIVGGTATLDGQIWIDWQPAGKPVYGAVFNVLSATSVIDNGIVLTGDLAGWFDYRMAAGDTVLQLISTIPEPTTLALLLLGGLGLVRRRQTR